MRSEHYQPLLSDRESREDWESKGKPVTWEKAAEIVKQIWDSDGYRLTDYLEQKIRAEIPGITG
jgi:trimethylamine:corrinoid methyltransferase-like protein